jgi:hypothetical protein
MTPRPTDPAPTRRRFLARSAALAAGVTLGATGRANENGDVESPDENFVTPDVLRTVERGLAYLGRSQQHDGSWGEGFQYQADVAVTSLAALALMAGGHQPGRGPYGDNVQRALAFVLSKEVPGTPGFLYNHRQGGGMPMAVQQRAMYSHGFGTLFLAEVYGMIPDRDLAQRTRGTIERAIQLIVNAQNKDGGWRYTPKPEQADISVTICQIMALRAARNAGFFVPKSTVERCIKYVRECQTSDGGFSYFKQVGASAFARSAAGVVALYCAGVYEGKEIDRGLKYLMQYKPSLPLARRDIPDAHYYYGQYYAAQAMWTAGRNYWAEWFPAIRDELLDRARGRGDNGSPWSDPTVCNPYATAMACIILQIPNNYLPILQK